MSKSSRNSLPDTTSALSVITAGREATGNSCPGFFGFAGRGDGAPSVKDELPQIGRWKMIDNLRRTLSAPTAVLALALGWTLPIYPALVWTSFVLATIIVPSLIPVISAIPSRRPGAQISAHLRALGGDLGLAAVLTALNVTFLADQTRLMSDAILRTLWRLFVSRRHLLEWVPAAQTLGRPRLDLVGFVARMSGAIYIAVAALLVALLFGHGAWPVAAPFVALWLVSPAVARAVSVPREASRARRTPPRPTC